MTDSPQYHKKKEFYDSLITLYGRHVVLEALYDKSLSIHKLHLAKSNQFDNTIRDIESLAKSREIPIARHDKKTLSRISKNARQDQGVALDVASLNYINANQIEQHLEQDYRLLAIDGIHNPQNLGLLIRSAAAGNIDGLILPKDNTAKISPLVIKASAGTLFKIKIFYCQTLAPVLSTLRKSDAKIYRLSSHAKTDILSRVKAKQEVFVLGNESDGVSEGVEKICTESLSIQMNRGIESLNVAVTAALIAFLY
ncbi:MAG: RNA methyltransferase [Gammaproteobacteria bacterium]|nr:RNA methyltransferase [Gammaproteobacteria bacterium]